MAQPVEPRASRDVEPRASRDVEPRASRDDVAEQDPADEDIDGQDDAIDDDADAEPVAPKAVRTSKTSSRGRGSRVTAPASLVPSRIPQHRIQIGPRIRPPIHTRFSEYVHDLANTGLTQSDIVESALIEYMDKYPPEVLRTALLEAR
jgi:hypothetical protein